jgi:putative CocE/NonD family hydrolase
MVQMRDGVRLHTTLYMPKDREPTYPVLLRRTPYSCRPYGAQDFPERLASEYLLQDGYIFVCQDVRGRWMSEGDYDNMRPHVAGELPVDESSDAYDTIEWILENVSNHNGRVGMYGISYPGFYTAAALPEAHPALVASSPQAPIADFFFDDFHHRGAFTLSYFIATALFGYQTDEPSTEPWYEVIRSPTPDAYQFYKDLGPLSNAVRYYGDDNFFWRQLTEHPNYDEFWQQRNLLPHLRDIDDAVMVVGGWFDAEDLYGPLNIYRTIEENNPDAVNLLVMGPWTHGDWSRDLEHQMVGDIWFGDGISEFFQREVEAPYFRHFLHGSGDAPSFEALVYDTGRREWQRFDSWPPVGTESVRFYLRDEEVLSRAAPIAGEDPHTEYVSDPNEPVPHTDRIRITFTPRPYMAEDQRFAERRPDVIEFQTPRLEAPVTLAGGITARLHVSTTGTDADWVVKLVDVYPPDEPNNEHTPEGVQLAGYQQMVRSEIMRGRFRESFEDPKPFVPGEAAVVEFPLQDVFHTFAPGHRIMVQVQSTWFPLFDLNPQTFVPNIFQAEEEDFVSASHRVFHRPDQASWIEVLVLPGEAAGGPAEGG